MKSIVVDFDDTLSFCKNREWDSANPNRPLISKLNELFDRGYAIHVVTARGQLSCGGKSSDADKKYRGQIEKFLATHGLKYTSLSFEKKLGLYYIDDKGITPEDFLEKVDLRELPGGLSNSSVVYDAYNNVVHKTADDSLEVIRWFNQATEYNYLVPHINKIIGNTITMEYIVGDHIDATTYQRAKNLAKTFAHLPAKEGNENLKQKYVARCINGIKDEMHENWLKVAEEAISKELWYLKGSFGHGDFSRTNMLIDSKNRLYMFDPIVREDLYLDYNLDIAKLQFSMMMDGIQVNDEAAIGLVLSHACRVLPYAKKKDTAKYARCFSIIGKLLEEYSKGKRYTKC